VGDTIQQLSVRSYRCQRRHVLPWVDIIYDDTVVLFLVTLEAPRVLHRETEFQKVT